MQQDLDEAYPELDIQLLGMNQVGSETGNPTSVEGRDIPWLQDVDDDGDGESDIWTRVWDVEFRDVAILDGENSLIATYNLTDNDLAEPENYAALRTMLVDAALEEVDEDPVDEDPVDEDPVDDTTDDATAGLSGAVYVDANNNGTQDANETGISGSTIVLTGQNGLGNSVTMSMVTSDDGTYSFTGLPPGTYSVSQQQPRVLLDGHDTAGTHGGVMGEDQCTGIVLTGDDQASQYNFGEIGLRSEYNSLEFYLASAPPVPELLRTAVARGEQNTGTEELAESTQPPELDTSLSEQNLAPVAVEDTFEARIDETFVVDAAAGLLANDFDPDGDVLRVEAEAEPLHGDLELSTNGSFTYVPDAGFTGVDSFTYFASDGIVTSEATTATVEVIDPQDESDLVV